MGSPGSPVPRVKDENNDNDDIQHLEDHWILFLVAWHDDTRCHELWAESFKTGLLEGVHLPNILRFIWYYDMILCDKKCTVTDWMEKTFMILFHV